MRLIIALLLAGWHVLGSEVITRGDRVDLTRHLERDRFVLFDFYADWCGPCRQLEPHLEQLARERSEVVVKKVDIINWNTPVTQQYSIRSIPHLKLFDRSGELISEGGAAQVLNDLDRALRGDNLKGIAMGSGRSGSATNWLPRIGIALLALFALGTVALVAANRKVRLS